VEQATEIVAAAEGAPRAPAPSAARLLVPRPAPATSQSAYQPCEDAAPLQIQGVGEGGSAELAAPTSSAGHNLAAIALSVPVKQTGGSPRGHTHPYQGWRQISHFRTNAYLKLSRPSPAAPSWPTLGKALEQLVASRWLTDVAVSGR
jgi:hypothetical protein